MLNLSSGAMAVRWRPCIRSVWACLLVGLGGCYSAERPNTPNAAVIVRPSAADYEPSIIYENGLYRMWWCGDGNIYYAESASLDSGWHRTGSSNANCPGSTQCEIALAPRGVIGSFDRSDVCDPSVIRVGSTYYMYYGGTNYIDAGGASYFTTNVGLATSADGINWTRVNADTDPLLQATPAIGCPLANPLECAYGLGQPSVFYDLEGDGRFYMLFMQSALRPCTTDAGCDGSSGSCETAAGYCRKGGNPNQLFVVRATDAVFRTNTQVWAASQWQWQSYTPRRPAVSPNWAIANGCCSDWQYMDVGEMVVRTGPGISLEFMSVPAFVPIRAYDFNPPPPAAIEVFLTEGPGIVRRPDGHSLTSRGATAFDLVRSVCDTGTATCPSPNCGGCLQWDLAHVGVDLVDLPGRHVAAIESLLLSD